MKAERFHGSNMICVVRAFNLPVVSCDLSARIRLGW